MPDYQRFRDPRVDYVMIVVGIENRDGTFGAPFHVRITEEEYENLQAQSRRQYERRQWPTDTQGSYRPADRPRSERPSFNFSDGFGGEPYTFFFTSEERDFYGRQEGYSHEQQKRAYEEYREKNRERERTQGKGPEEKPTAPKRSDAQARMRLAELAGISWPTDIQNPNLYKRAQRKCHPDIEGGSHDLWIELEDIARQLRLIKVKDTTGSNRQR
jgi:hypothetical protein